MRNCVSQRLPTHCSSRTPTIYFKGTTFRGATPQESRQFHACGCHAAPRPSELSSGPVLSHAAVEVPGPRARAGPGVCGTAQNTDPSARGQSVSPRTRPYLRSSNPPPVAFKRTAVSHRSAHWPSCELSQIHGTSPARFPRAWTEWGGTSVAPALGPKELATRCPGASTEPPTTPPPPGPWRGPAAGQRGVPGARAGGGGDAGPPPA